jgi:cyclic pyranopterin phosphate synthase
MSVSELSPQVDRLGRPLHDLRISVMDRCNFRCPYCMPEDQYHPKFQFMTQRERLSFAEILRLTGLFAGLGVRKLRITGGEPLLRSQLSELISELSLIGGIEDIALTTNGVLLRQHAAALKAAGLHRVTVSFDSLDDEIFNRLSGGRGGKERVLEGIREALDVGLAPIKVNVVLQKGINEDGMFDLLEYFRNTGVVLRFIEYMDVGTINHWSPNDIVSSAELVTRIGQRWPLEPLDSNYHGEVARRYKYKDGAGEIGFISSVSEPFCRDCTRARLSSDGKLFLCLFAEQGLNLRGPMREGASDGDLLALISNSWRARTDRYSEQRVDRRNGNGETHRVEMYYIGG